MSLDQQVDMEQVEKQRPPSITEREAYVFELVKLDYTRLGTQEQSILDGRLQIWIIFFAIVAGPTGYAGIAGLRGSIFMLALIPFFIACLSLHIKHSERVLRYDIRKTLKGIAAQWGYTNHDSSYSDQEQQEHRWWHSWYKYGLCAAFVASEIVDTVFVCWYCSINGLATLSIALAVFNVLLILITSWCVL